MIILKNLLRDYFIFSKRERRGVISLSIIIILVWTIHFVSTLLFNPVEWDVATIKKEIIELQNLQAQNETNHTKKQNEFKNKEFQKASPKPKLEIKPTNPNKLKFKEWMALGFSFEETRSIFEHKKNKGFIRSVNDLYAIPSLPKEKIQKSLSFFIFQGEKVIMQKEDYPHNKTQISGDPITAIENIKNKSENTAAKKKHPEIFEINSCNPRTLKQLDCLDSITIKKIIAHRKALGGFVSINQLLEIDSISKNCLQLISALAITDTSFVRKIDINNISISNLGRHPYIGYNVATALINFRDKHGKFKSPDDLKRCMIMTKERIEKIKPYLDFK